MVMTPSASFCALAFVRDSSSKAESIRTHVVEDDVGDLAERLALFPDVLLQIEQE